MIRIPTTAGIARALLPGAAAWLLAAGAVAQEPPDLGRPGAGDDGPVVTETPALPAPAVEVPLVAPVEGTRFVFRTTFADGRVGESTWTVLPDDTWNGQEVSRLGRNDEVQILDRETRNWMALERDGEMIQAAEPHRGVWRWPLRVGDSWTAEFTWYDFVRSFTVGPIGTRWTVEAVEEIEVPAGRFSALRLRGEPTRNNTRRILLWYAAETGSLIRRVEQQATDTPGEMTTVTTELVAREIP